MTNYENTKHIIKALLKQRLTGCEYAVCLYLLDELYGYMIKPQESASYHHIAGIIGFEERQVRRSINILVKRQILVKKVYATKFGNGYNFNDPELWQT